MADKEIPQIKADIATLAHLIQINEEGRRKFEENLKDSLNKFKILEPIRIHKDITTEINSGEVIQLDSYKCFPELSGNKTEYRSWREQVVQRIDIIKDFKNHPKYEAALGIMRAKMTKSASDILINKNTVYNIDAIIERLDLSFADHCT